MTLAKDQVIAPPERFAPPDDTYDLVYAHKLLITVIFGVVAFSSSSTIVTAALGAIAEDFHSSAGTISWGVTGLFLTMAIGTPVMGRVGDAIGRRQVFLFGSATLTLSMVLCALAWDPFSFIAFRMLTGIGIACTMPNGMAMVIDAHPPERRAVAIGWFQMVMSGAPVFGLVIGGAMAEAFGWRSVFVLIAPIGAIGFAIGLANVRKTGPARAGVTVDWYGAASLGAGTLAFLLGLERMKTTGINDRVAIGLFVSAALALGAFVLIEQRVRQPLLRLGYFKRRNFTGPLIAQPFAQFAYMGGFVITPLLLKDEFHLGVQASSLILLFRPGMYSLASPFGGRLATRLGPRTMVIIGGLLVVVSMLVFVAGARAELLWLIVVALVLSGLALGLATPSYSTAVSMTVDAGDLGVANGMASTIMNIGTLTGIQTMFVLLGESRASSTFGHVFLAGALVASIGLVGGFIMSPQTLAPRRET